MSSTDNKSNGDGGKNNHHRDVPSSFRDKLEARVAATNSLLCVGLDPHQTDLFPAGWDDATPHARCDAAFTFCKNLVDSTSEYAACYKPNAAFFEALGDGGLECLRRVIRTVISPTGVPCLLDAKRGDIGSTASAYAEACFDYLGADAVTLSPLMGWDSVKPFVTGKYAGKGAFLLCKTSNPGSNDFLALTLANTSRGGGEETLYERIAATVGGGGRPQSQNNGNGNDDQSWSEAGAAFLGLVVGATDAEALRRARAAAAGDGPWILAPGVGAQGGDLQAALAAGLNAAGTGMLVPISRGISRAENPGEAAKSYAQQIRAAVDAIIVAKKRGQDHAAAGNGDGRHYEQESSEPLLLPHQRSFIEFSLEQGVLKFGSFVLKSGRTSPYFFNAGLFATGKALHTLGRAYANAIMTSPELLDESGKGVNFDVIFGPAYKGISLGAVVSGALYQYHGVDVGFCYNRKEAKDHGEGGLLVGAPVASKRVLIVDDVITAGTAIREAYQQLTTTTTGSSSTAAAAAKPVGVVIALDRAEIRSPEDRVSAVQAVSRDLKIPVASIVSLPQLQTFLEQQQQQQQNNSSSSSSSSTSGYFDAETLERVATYRMEYGV